MRLSYSRRFDAAYDRLGSDDKQAVQKALAMLVENPRSPSLRMRKLATEENVWEASPSRRLRMTFQIEGEIIVLRAVGGHEILRRP